MNKLVSLITASFGLAMLASPLSTFAATASGTDHTLNVFLKTDTGKTVANITQLEGLGVTITKPGSSTVVYQVNGVNAQPTALIAHTNTSTPNFGVTFDFGEGAHHHDYNCDVTLNYTDKKWQKPKVVHNHCQINFDQTHLVITATKNPS